MKSDHSLLTINNDTLEVRMTRTFDAPREMVFRAYTDPALVAKWWGLRRTTTTIEKLDLRPGGEWRFVERDNEGNEYAFHGVIREVTPPERYVYTFEYEGIPPGHEILETVLFEERDGKTTVTAIDNFKTAEDMQGMINAGMEEGAKESYNQLEELLRAQQ